MKVGGGVPRAPCGPRPPPRAPRPRAAPTSAPPHHTPVRSGWPSAMRGTGPAGAVSDDADAPRPLSCPDRPTGTDHASASAHPAVTIAAIVRLMIEFLSRLTAPQD